MEQSKMSVIDDKAERFIYLLKKQPIEKQLMIIGALEFSDFANEKYKGIIDEAQVEK